MREVAYLDIPLSQIVTQIEFIELEQHLQLEEYRVQLAHKAKQLKPHHELIFQKRKLKRLQDRAVAILENNLQNLRVLLDVADHKKVEQQLLSYRKQSDAYEAHLDHIYQLDRLNPQEVQQTEQLAVQLEAEQKSLLQLINHMAASDADATEKHEEDFFLINVILGTCAMVLGLLLTLYIIRIIMRRVNNIQRQIKTFGGQLSVDDELTPQYASQTRDELEELEHDVSALMSQLSKEIASREQIEKQLLQLATRDKLTGLYNRHKWDEQISHSIKLAQRDYPFGLILLDIDYFKKINDQYGHLVGDNLLKSLALIMKREIREVDAIFRLGGEEFAIICPMNASEDIGVVAEKLRAAVDDTHDAELPHFTVSLGIAGYQPGDSVATLFKRADSALYQAKDAGRNCVMPTTR